MKRSRVILGLLAVGSLALGACGSDSEEDSATTSADTAAPETTGSPETTGASGGDTTTSEAGGSTAADPNLPEVRVGWHNLEGGQVSLPDVRYGFEAGMKYVNEELGGINGHPMTAEVCNVDVTPDSSVNCANKFVESGVVVGVQGVDFMFDAALPIYQQAGLADITPFALGPASNTAQGDVFTIEFSNEEGYAAGLQLIKDLDAGTKVAQVLSDQPSLREQYDKTIVPVAEKLGLEITPTFYGPAADWATTAATILSGNPDVVSVFATDADCSAAVPALRTAGFEGLIVAGVCTAFISQMDEAALENIVSGSPFFAPDMSPMPEAPAADMEIFNRYMEETGHADAIPSMAMQGFFTAVTVADMLRQIPGDELTAESVHAGLASVKGDRLFFRTNGYDCSAPSWPGTTACGTGFIYGKITATGREILPNQPVDVSGLVD